VEWEEWAEWEEWIIRMLMIANDACLRLQFLGSQLHDALRIIISTILNHCATGESNFFEVIV